MSDDDAAPPPDAQNPRAVEYRRLHPAARPESVRSGRHFVYLLAYIFGGAFALVIAWLIALMFLRDVRRGWDVGNGLIGIAVTVPFWFVGIGLVWMGVEQYVRGDRPIPPKRRRLRDE